MQASRIRKHLSRKALLSYSLRQTEHVTSFGLVLPDVVVDELGFWSRSVPSSGAAFLTLSVMLTSTIWSSSSLLISTTSTVWEEFPGVGFDCESCDEERDEVSSSHLTFVEIESWSQIREGFSVASPWFPSLSISGIRLFWLSIG